MRTTIRLPDELYGEVRRRSVESGVTVTSFIEEALRAAINQQSAQTKPFEVVPFTGDGVQPGVDLFDSASLLDVMED